MGQRWAENFASIRLPAATQQLPAIAMDAAGNFVITWQSAGNQDGSGFGAFGQLFSANGTIRGAEFRANTFTANSQSNPSVAMRAG